MTEDRSLGDFLGDDSPSESADSPVDDGETDDGDGTGSDEKTVDAPADDEAGRRGDDVSPTVGTYRWDPAGVDCPDCGEAVDRLWLDDGERVCADCKAW